MEVMDPAFAGDGRLLRLGKRSSDHFSTSADLPPPPAPGVTAASRPLGLGFLTSRAREESAAQRDQNPLLQNRPHPFHLRAGAVSYFAISRRGTFIGFDDQNLLPPARRFRCL